MIVDRRAGMLAGLSGPSGAWASGWSRSRRAAVVTALLSAVLACGISLVVTAAVAHAEVCPNAVFRNGPSSRLPECRAYEMVTPVYKEGFSVSFDADNEAGSRVLGNSLGDFAGAESDALDLVYFNNIDPFGLLGSFYEFSRGGSGWEAEAVGLPTSLYSYPAVFATTPDLSESLSVALPRAAHAALEAEGRTFTGSNYPASFYVRRGSGPVSEIGPIAPPSARSPGHEYFYFAGASLDLSHVLFGLKEDYWPGDETSGRGSLYEYVGTGNVAPMLVGVSGGGGSTSLVSRCGTELGSLQVGEARETGDSQGAVSPDGSVIFFTALACGGSPPVSEIFARVDSGQADAHTVAISEPSVQDCAECDTEPRVLAGATFIAGSEDGSKVFFMTTQPLLGHDTSNNLYEYDSDLEAGHRVLRVSGGDAAVSAHVEQVLHVSRDGSHVYFTAGGMLTESPNSRGEKAQGGQSNLYLYERDAQYPAGRIAFIAPAAILIERQGGNNEVVEETNEGFYEDYGLEVRASENGRFLVFGSYAHLTPDTFGPAPQVFEYDAQTGLFARVTRGQNGFNDDGNASGLSGLGSPGSSELYDIQYAYLVANNGAVFFSSDASLVPQAVSGQTEVYEYHEGAVSLISDGQSPSGSELKSITPSGQDVFFETPDQLVGRDVDNQVDIYDARIDGGFPEPPPAAPCEGEACQGTPAGAPVLLSPGSEFQAGGEGATLNAAPAPAPKASKRTPQAKKHARKAKRARKSTQSHKGQPKGKRGGVRAVRRAVRGTGGRGVREDGR
jgi:hypothetical protein